MCEDGCMDAQNAIYELSRYILGQDWYIVYPVNDGQANPIIVLEIENKIKENKRNLKKRRIEKRIQRLKNKI